MMVAGLVDGDDFNASLSGVGISVPGGATPGEGAAAAVRADAEAPVAGLAQLAESLAQQQGLLLPEVAQAVREILLPGLQANERARRTAASGV